MGTVSTGGAGEVRLWDGSTAHCDGFHEGLPVWRYNRAPRGLVTHRQLAAQRLRRRPGQEPVGLLVFRHRGAGQQIAELFRIDEAVESRTMTPRWQAAIEEMNRRHRTCRRCGHEADHRLPVSTRKCWPCMEATGDFGDPHAPTRDTEPHPAPSAERDTVAVGSSAADPADPAPAARIDTAVARCHRALDRTSTAVDQLQHQHPVPTATSRHQPAADRAAGLDLTSAREVGAACER